MICGIIQARGESMAIPRDLLDKLSKEYHIDNKNILRDVVDKYDYLFGILKESHLLSEVVYYYRWNIPDAFLYNRIFKNLISLRKNNALHFVDNVSVIGTYKNVVDLAKLIEDYAYIFECEGNMFEIEYYRTFHSLYYTLVRSDSNEAIDRSIHITSEEKDICDYIYKIHNALIREYGKDRFNSHLFDYETIISVAYNYFKLNSMFISNHDEVMRIFRKMYEDREYLIDKINNTKINVLDDMVTIFKEYYRDPLIYHIEIK